MAANHAITTNIVTVTKVELLHYVRSLKNGILDYAVINGGAITEYNKADYCYSS